MRNKRKNKTILDPHAEDHILIERMRCELSSLHHALLAKLSQPSCEDEADWCQGWNDCLRYLAANINDLVPQHHAPKKAQQTLRPTVKPMLGTIPPTAWLPRKYHPSTAKQPLGRQTTPAQ
jgi:hypothetical protein